jgi:hypothetical protein
LKTSKSAMLPSVELRCDLRGVIVCFPDEKTCSQTS